MGNNNTNSPPPGCDLGGCAGCGVLIGVLSAIGASIEIGKALLTGNIIDSAHVEVVLFVFAIFIIFVAFPWGVWFFCSKDGVALFSSNPSLSSTPEWSIRAEAEAEVEAELESDFPIDINSASIEMLEKIPFIGKQKAIEIHKFAPYSNIEDLKNLKGFSDRTIRRISEFIIIKN